MTSTNNRIINFSNPVGSADAVSRSYVDLTCFRKGLEVDISNKNITRLADPVNPQDATNKSWVETHTVGNYLALDGGTLTWDINMGDHKITNVREPVNDNDAANKKWVSG